jgi:hypothetical protein
MGQSLLANWSANAAAIQVGFRKKRKACVRLSTTSCRVGVAPALGQASRLALRGGEGPGFRARKGLHLPSPPRPSRTNVRTVAEFHVQPSRPLHRKAPWSAPQMTALLCDGAHTCRATSATPGFSPFAAGFDVGVCGISLPNRPGWKSKENKALGLGKLRALPTASVAIGSTVALSSPGPAGPPFSDVIASMRKEFAAGVPIARIARAQGVDWSTVWRRCADLRIKTVRVPSRRKRPARAKGRC